MDGLRDFWLSLAMAEIPCLIEALGDEGVREDHS
jgi:hypothetical protein